MRIRKILSLLCAVCILLTSIFSVSGANIDIISTGATSSSGVKLDSATVEKNYTGTNGAKTLAGNNKAVSRVITYYDKTAGTPYVYTDTQGVVRKKVYKIVITCGNITATWIVNESTLKSKTSDDGVGTLTVRSSDGSTGKWFEPTDGENAQTYTPWGVAMALSRVKNVVIHSNINHIGQNSFRGISALETLTCSENGTLATIGISSFRNCSNLTTILFANNPVKTIKNMAFRNCKNLKVAKVYNAKGNNVIAPIPSGVVNGSYSNILTIPSTLKTLEEECFMDCKSIEGINYLNTSELTTIGVRAFRNCTSLHFINVPDGLLKIEEYAFSTSEYDEDGASSKVLYISSDNSMLEYIGNNAFYNALPEDELEYIPDGVKIYDKEKGEVKASDSEPFIFRHLTYLGTASFRNNLNFTGKYLLYEYCNVGAATFVFTNLTNLYCRYDSNAKANEDLTYDSSLLGSSNSYVSTTNNYAIKSEQEIIIDGKKYHSLYHILNQNIEKWHSFFNSIGSQKIPYEDWKAGFKVDEKGNLLSPQTKDSNCPELSYGISDNNDKTNPIKGNKTSSYLKTETEWIKGQEDKKATETITFGYKNLPKVDYVFIVDNSPSMDTAHTGGVPHEGTNNVSKTTTAFSQIYNIVKNVLPDEVDTSKDFNTVSIVSFNGSRSNELSKSSRQLGQTGMTTVDEVYTALFETDDGYDNGGVTNWSAGFSRAYFLLEELQNTYNHRQVVIFLSDGSPTYYTWTDGAVGVSPESTDTASTQVNGLDWARAIKGSSDLKYKVRHYTNSYYKVDGKGDVTSNTSTQSVNGLGVEIHGILVGTTAEKPSQNMYKITNPYPELTMNDDLNNDKMLDLIQYNERTNFGEDMTKLSKALTQIISKTSSEDYTVVVPFDDNFSLDTSAEITISLLDDDGNLKVDTNSDGEENKGYTFKLTNNVWQSDTTSYSNYGRVKYDSNLNRIIWDLSTHTDYGGTTSSSYQTYQLTVTLNLIKGGYTTLGNTTSLKYYAVSDNSPETSRNGANGNSAVSDLYYGAYAYMNTPSYSNDVPNDPTESSKTLMNVAPAIYLPNLQSTFFMYKKSDNGEGLTNAKFQIYDENYELVKFYEIKVSFRETTYEYYDGGEIIENYYDIVDTLSLGSSYSDLIIKNLPQGTYYITEVEYPETTEYSYSWSEKNQTVVITPSGKDTAINCIELVVDLTDFIDVETKDITIYNKPISKVGRIEGLKVDENGIGLAGAKIGLYSSYPSSTSSPIETSISNENGVYAFSVNAIGTYFIKEIEAPIGYEYTSTIRTVEVTSLEITSTVKDTIVNRKMAKIIVHVDSSDYKKDGFTYSLTSSNNANYSYKGTTKEDGIYTFLVPVTFNGMYSLSYSLEQIETPNDYYLSPELSFKSFEDENATYKKLDIGTVQPGSETHIYVYNPSVKVTVSNYDGTDKVTPLQSDISVNESSYSTDERGTFTTNEWFGLSSNVLEQTKVQNGYNLLAEKVDFKITNNSIEKAYDENGQRYYKHNEIIYNTPKYTLPMTGGIGTIRYVVVGTTFIGVAVLMFLIYKKRCKL